MKILIGKRNCPICSVDILYYNKDTYRIAGKRKSVCWSCRNKSISNHLKGKKKSKDHAKNISKGLKGKSKTEEHKRKLSEIAKKRKFSKETREKISKAMLGRFVSQETRDKRAKTLTGTKRPEEMKRKLSATKQGVPLNEWIGYTKPEILRLRLCGEYSHWRQAVFKRDKYTCQICYATKVFLNAHHIKSFATCIEERFEITNGITLCEKCHIETHKKLRKEIAEQF